LVVTMQAPSKRGSILKFHWCGSLVPVLGLLFNFTSIVGAALWAADLENQAKQKHFREEPSTGQPVQDSKSPPRAPKASPPQGAQSAASAVPGETKKEKEPPTKLAGGERNHPSKDLKISTSGLGASGAGRARKEV
jgi:hypothetical protein